MITKSKINDILSAVESISKKEVKKDKDISAKGPIGKFFSQDALAEIMKKTNCEIGDSIFLACAKTNDLEKITFSKQDGFVLPNLILIYFKGSVFKVYEN